ncbi:MAG: MBL fold metallo-hydrolase [Ignavibacteriaceae bacterium]|nr:MBL fold metallo-hydrolase [Ignavibacteriaceae bacterium]
MKIKKFTFNPFFENTYVIYDEKSKEAAVIDPGNSDENETEELFGFAESNNLKIRYLINTHCHIDHVFGNSAVKRKFNPEFLAPEPDMFLLRAAKKQGELFGVEVESSPEPDQFITEQTELTLGEFKLNFIFTPGHTPGEYCVYNTAGNILIAGDVLFNEGIGRTDLWGGDMDTLLASIKEKLYALPDETLVYCGHGDETTIGHEKKHNPFIKA